MSLINDYTALPPERQQRVLLAITTYLVDNVDHSIEQAFAVCVLEEYFVYGGPDDETPRGNLSTR